MYPSVRFATMQCESVESGLHEAAPVRTATTEMSTVASMLEGMTTNVPTRSFVGSSHLEATALGDVSVSPCLPM
ncbi:MAG TPA: hypothetical protein VH054_22875 [Polyangiaceae bacterium]|jgi:hypothetical protein|nr:hypothetical protein [Polyangiaceae bacterium]